MRRSLMAAVALVLTALTQQASAEPASKVYLNGVPSPVFFNDGDSFRVLGGQHAGMKARLAGYNTLETHGPVHRWGDWHYKELYVLAKEATLFARAGEWHCTSDLKTDTYGRALWYCPDLAEALIRRGLAHAMSVTLEPADAKYVAAQREAIAAKRGIWAHGVPDYVLTSLHSTDEDVSRRGTYNRLVSSADGHSMKWKHDRAYKECEEVCDPGYDSPERLERAAAALRADPAVAELVGAYDDAKLSELLSRFGEHKDWVELLADPAQQEALGAALERLRLAGKVGRIGGTSCSIYTDFRRRYGGGKAACLKW